jgi:hypothetical protein
MYQHPDPTSGRPWEHPASDGSLTGSNARTNNCATARDAEGVVSIALNAILIPLIVPGLVPVICRASLEYASYGRLPVRLVVPQNMILDPPLGGWRHPRLMPRFPSLFAR